MKREVIRQAALPPIQEMAEAVASLVNFQMSQGELTREEASMRNRDEVVNAVRSRALEGPVEHISWDDLGTLAEADPAACEAAWQRVYDSAETEVLSGNAAARAMKHFGYRPIDRAVFLTLRDHLISEWEPRPGSELQIIDMMAQTLTLHGMWLSRHSGQSILGFERSRESGQMLPPRVHEADALEQSAMMVERYQKMYLRLVRTLKELRKGSPPVVVQNAEQVNVGQQQVNVGKIEGK
jgi:hypothetical protein